MSGREPDSEFVVRRAAKSWQCASLCGVTINPGDRYLEYLGEAPAYQSGSRYCAICAVDVWGMDAAHFYDPIRLLEYRLERGEA